MGSIGTGHVVDNSLSNTDTLCLLGGPGHYWTPVLGGSLSGTSRLRRPPEESQTGTDFGRREGLWTRVFRKVVVMIVRGCT